MFMNLLSNLLLFYQRKIEPGFKISKRSLVVDIGSGDKPFWRADVFVDKLSLGNIQRTSKSPTIHNLGKFVDADVHKMPFKDKFFDFSFCSHLLEHVEDPQSVLREIIRISKGGYLEVPNGILETIQPFDSHLWFVFLDKKKLIFVRKSKKIHNILTKNGQIYKTLLGKVNHPFIRLYWRNHIAYEIVDNYTRNEKFVSITNNLAPYGKKFNLYVLLIKLIRLFFYKNKQNNFFKTQK